MVFLKCIKTHIIVLKLITDSQGLMSQSKQSRQLAGMRIKGKEVIEAKATNFGN